MIVCKCVRMTVSSHSTADESSPFGCETHYRFEWDCGWQYEAVEEGAKDYTSIAKDAERLHERGCLAAQPKQRLGRA